MPPRHFPPPWTIEEHEAGRRSFPEYPPRVLFAQSVSDAFAREAHKLGERRVRPT
jgi:hypothetical protein